MSGPRVAICNAQGTDWEIVEDYRYSTVVDAQGKPVQITTVGPLPEGCRYVEPEVVEFERAQSTALETLKAVRLAHEYAGPLVLVDGVPVRFPSEVKDETRLNSLSLMFAADPTLEVPDWKISDDVYVTMTAPLLMEIRAAGSLHIAVCFSVERAKREEVRALPSAEAVAAWLASDLNAGWPE